MPTWTQAATVMGLAALPVSELRGALPLALVYGFDPLSAYLLSVVGNLLPVPALLWGLERVLALAPRLPGLGRLLGWWSRRTRRRGDKAFARFGALALILFVAVPLPMTGAWTGSLAAVLFRVPFRPALGLIALGVALAGLVVLVASWLGARLL